MCGIPAVTAVGFLCGIPAVSTAYYYTCCEMYLLGVLKSFAVCLLGMPRPIICIFVEGASSYSNIGFDC